MPSYRITLPSGRSYQVDGPDGFTQQQAYEYVANMATDFDTSKVTRFATGGSGRTPVSVAGAGSRYDPLRLDAPDGAQAPEDDHEAVYRSAPVGAWVRRPDGSIEQRDATFGENLAGAGARGLAALREVPGRLRDALTLDNAAAQQGAAQREIDVREGRAEPGLFEVSEYQDYQRGLDPIARLGVALGLREAPKSPEQRLAESQNTLATEIPQIAQREAQRSQRIEQVRRETEELRPQSVRALDRAQGAGETIRAIARNPVDTIANVGVESSVQFAPAMVVGLVTRNPTAVALASGGSSASIEMANGLTDYASRNGVDTTDPEQMKAFLSDQNNLRSALDYARTRAGIVGSVDAMTGPMGKYLHLGDEVIGNIAAREAANIATQTGAQMAAGAGGEAAAQYVTTGEIDGKDVVLEAAGELTSTPGEVAGFAMDRAAQTSATRAATAAPVQAQPNFAPTMPAPAEPVSEAKPRITYEELVRQRDARRAQREADLAAGNVTAGAAAAENLIDEARANRVVPLDAQERDLSVAAAASAKATAETAAPAVAPAVAQETPSAPVADGDVAALTAARQEAVRRANDKALPKEQRAVARKEAALLLAKIDAASVPSVEASAKRMLDQAASQSIQSAQPAPLPVVEAPPAAVAPPMQQAPVPQQAPAVPAATPPPAVDVAEGVQLQPPVAQQQTVTPADAEPRAKLVESRPTGLTAGAQIAVDEQRSPAIAEALSRYAPLIRGNGDATPLSKNEVMVAQLAPEQARRVARLSRVLGRNIVFFDVNAANPDTVLGFANDAKNIYVSVRADQAGYSPVALIGHEFVHTLRKSNRRLFDELSSFAKARERADGGHLGRLREEYAKAYKFGTAQELDDAISEELLADYVGGLLNDDAFWAELSAENPTLFERVIQDIIQFLTTLARRAQTLGAEDSYNDIDALRAKAKDILARHMAGELTSTMTDRTEAVAAEYESLLNSVERDRDMRAAGLSEVEQLRRTRDPALLAEIEKYALPDLRQRGGMAVDTRLKTAEVKVNERRLRADPISYYEEIADRFRKKYGRGWEERLTAEEAAVLGRVEKAAQDAAGGSTYEPPNAKAEIATANREMARGEYKQAAARIGAVTTGRPRLFELDTPEKRKFAEGVTPSSRKGDVMNTFVHGTARDITAFRPKQGESVFLTRNPAFAAPYAGASMEWKEQNDPGAEVTVAGRNVNDIIADPKEDATTKIAAAVLQSVSGDIDRALDVLPNYTDDEGNPLQSWEEDDVRMELEDWQARQADDSRFIETNSNRDTTGMNMMPLVAGVKKTWDFDNKQHTTKLIDALVEKYDTPQALSRAAATPRFYTRWSEIGNEIRDGEWGLLEDTGVGIPQMLREMGYDSYHISEEGEKNLAVLDPRRIKSATGNVGSFGVRPPTAEEAASLGMTLEEALAAQEAGDIRLKLNMAQVQANIGAAFARIKTHEGWASMERFLIDEYRDLREVQKAIGKQWFGAPENLPDSMNVWRRENLRHGAFQDQRQRAEERFIEPIAKLLSRSDLDAEGFSDYLWWRHAPERDAYLRSKLDPAIAATTGPADLAGISPADAVANIAALDPKARKAYEAAARYIDAMRAYTLKTLRDSGQITDEHYNNLVNQYRYYVPLRGKPGGDPDSSSTRGGASGLSMRKSPTGPRAAGRKSKAENIMEQMVSDMDNALVGVHKQAVLSSLVRLIARNPDPDLWEVQPVVAERKWVDGVIRVVQTNGAKENQITFMHNGIPVAIEIRHEGMRRAMLNLDGQDVPKMLRAVGRVTRWLSAVKTSFSPFFLLINPVRDAAFATMAIGSEHGMGAVRGMARFYPLAYGAISLDNRAQGRGAARLLQSKGANQDRVLLQQYAREFAAAGGKTGYTYVSDIREQQAKLASLMSRHAKTKGMKDIMAGNFKTKDATLIARKAWNSIGHLFEVVNDLAENSTRLAAFAAMRERGMNIEQAAAYAKELTVNFNRRGVAAKYLGNLYMFFNAAMQGSARMTRLMANPKFAGTMGGLFAVSYALALGQMVAAGDDDDGESLYEKDIGDMTAQRAIGIRLGDGNSLAIPVPYGPNIFSYAGYRMARMHYDMMRNKPVKIGSVAGDIFGQAVSSMSPLDPGRGWTAMLPEAARIPAQTVVNTNDFGGKIAPKLDPFDRTNPANYTQTDVKTGGLYRFAAMAINRATGGDAYEGGALNPAGEHVRYVAEQFTGGMGRLASQSYELFENLFAGVDPEPSDVPLANVYFRGKNEPMRTAGRYYENMDDYKRYVRQWQDAVEYGDQDKIESLLRVAPWIEGAEQDASTREGKAAQAGSVMETARLVEKNVKALRRAKDALYADPELGVAERVRQAREIDLQIEQWQRMFNTAFNAGTSVQTGP